MEKQLAKQNELNFNTEAGIEFRSVIKSKNFITPEINGYTKRGDLLIELSSGTRIIGTGLMFGVTVAKKGIGIDIEKSKLFNNIKIAKAYILTL